MRILFFTAIMLLQGCFGPAEFDASSENTLESSTERIEASLSESQKEEFSKALLYFSMGGTDGFTNLMSSAFSGNLDIDPSTTALTNLSAIDGLTGTAILEKYRRSIEDDQIRYEKEASERESIQALQNEAESFLSSNKFEEALERYKAMGEIASGTDIAEEGIADVTQKMEDFTEKIGYMANIEITEFVAKRIDTYSKKGVPAVRLSLKNNGDRSLDRVEIVVYFQDENGNTIYEEDYNPVLVSEYSFSGNSKPLKPGYVQEMETDKYYTLDSQLSEWQEGRAVAKIVDIQFTD